MTNDQIRIEVAKATGWTKHREGWHHSVLCHEGGRPAPPDYPNDLNACHEMEAGLTGFDWHRFGMRLEDIMWDGRGSDRMAYPVWHSTARQRCEAFLRVKGLWKDA